MTSPLRLIVSAALLAQVPTSFRIFGYPGLAMIFFLTAAAGGGALAGSIVLSDRKRREKGRGDRGRHERREACSVGLITVVMGTAPSVAAGSLPLPRLSA